MNLPDYFLADLPREATLGPAMILHACQTLKRNRQQYLGGRSARILIQIVSDLAGSWLKTDYPFRKLALEQGPAKTAFSRATLAAVLCQFPSAWRRGGCPWSTPPLGRRFSWLWMTLSWWSCSVSP